MFDTLIVEPLFNLLVLIYGLLPGNNFGLAIILFTIVIRIFMWPLVKKQLHQAKVMSALQPEIKKIKASTKGDRQKESMMLMELYKERGINPFGQIGVLIVQLVILIGLYSGLRRVVDDPQAVVDLSYSWLHWLPGVQELIRNIGSFDATLLGFIDLTRPAVNEGGGFYYPALMLVLGSAVAQFYQSKQLMPQDKEARSLRKILKEAGEGKQAEQGEVNAAASQGMKYILPVFIVFFTVGLPAALSLYWLVSGLVAYVQQAVILNQDEEEMEAIADKAPSGSKITILEGEVVKDGNQKTNNKKQNSGKKHKKSSSKKRRK